MARRMRRKVVRGADTGGDVTLDRGVAELDRLIDAERFDEAADALDRLWRTHPNHPRLLPAAAMIAQQLGDLEAMAEAARVLVELYPDVPSNLALAAIAHMQLGQPASAVLYLRRLERVQPDSEIDDVAWREDLGTMEEGLPAVLQRSGLDGPDAIEVGAQFERAQNLVELDRGAEALEILDEVIGRFPSFAAAIVTRAHAFAREGNLAAAVAECRRAVEADPGSAQGLASLATFLVRSGQVEEARQAAERLDALRPRTAATCVKRVLALSFLGDDKGVYGAYQEALRLDPDDTMLEDPQLLHVAAVSAWRLGHEDEARALWDTALEADPDNDVILDNLEDLELPEADRDAPWPYPFGVWLPEPAIDSALEPAGGAAGGGETAGVVDDYGAVERLIPLLLERGDPEAREYALDAALDAALDGDRPDMEEALRNFAAGKWGPLAMRQEAAKALGLPPPDGSAQT